MKRLWLRFKYYRACRGTDYYDPEGNMPWWTPYRCVAEDAWKMAVDFCKSRV